MNTNKKQPERMCMICRKKNDKNNLLRIVKQKDGSIFIDNSYNANGRGVYICNCDDCVRKAIKTRALNRAYKTEVSNTIYEDIENAYQSNKN